MEEERFREFRPEELAQFLEELAAQARRGAVTLEGRSLPLAGVIQGKVEVKAGRGGASVKLKFRWPTPEEYERAAAPEARRELANFKAIKKRLGAVFADILKTAGQGILPPEARVREFQDLSRDFARFAEPDWAAEIQEYLDHVENLARVFQERQLEMVRHELRDLAARMKTCHQEFK